MMNILGSKSVTFGYFSPSVVLKEDNAPAFNLAYRILSPAVFITLVSSFLYAVKLDFLVSNIWLIAVYQFGGRLLFRAIMGRRLLIGWFRECFIGLVTIFLCWLLYWNVIVLKTNLLPDFSTIANELWIIIGIFLFTVLNRLEVSH